MEHVETLRLMLLGKEHPACTISDFARTNLNFSNPQTLVAINTPVRQLGNQMLLDFLIERISTEKNNSELILFREMERWLKSKGALTLTQVITAHPAAARLYQLTQPDLKTLNAETLALFKEIENEVADIEKTNFDELPHLADKTMRAIKLYNHLKAMRNLLAQDPHHRQHALLPWLTFTLQDYLPTLSIFKNLEKSLQQVDPHHRPTLNTHWSAEKSTPKEAPHYQTIQAEQQASPVMQPFFNPSQRVLPLPTRPPGKPR